MMEIDHYLDGSRPNPLAGNNSRNFAYPIVLLDQYVRDLKTFMEEFTTALEAERTKLYLDTSLLIWLIRLGLGGRPKPANEGRLKTAQRS
jgi:hypothetical protein